MYRPALKAAILAVLAGCGEVKGNAPDAGGPDAKPVPGQPDASPVEDQPDAAVPCEWSAPLQVLRSPDDSGDNTAPAVTSNQLTMYFTSQVQAPTMLVATRADATRAWTRGGAPISGAFRVQDVSADGAELFFVDLANSRLLSSVRDSVTGQFQAPNPVNLPVAPVSIAPDRRTLYVLGQGQVLASARASNGAWPTPQRVLSWTDFDATSVDVGPDSNALLLTGPGGAAISRRTGEAWSAPIPLRGLTGTLSNGELVAADLIYFDLNSPAAGNEIYYSRCVTPP